MRFMFKWQENIVIMAILSLPNIKSAINLAYTSVMLIYYSDGEITRGNGVD